MSYEPSHRKPPRQERWPHATPAEGWPSCRPDDLFREGEPAARQGGYQAAGGYWDETGYQQAPGGSGYQPAVAVAPFRPAGNGYGYAEAQDGYHWAPDGYEGAGHGYSGSGSSRGDSRYGAAYGYGTAAGNGYGGDHGAAGNGYAGGISGYAGAPSDGFDGAPDGYRRGQRGYGMAAREHPGVASSHDWNADDRHNANAYDWNGSDWGEDGSDWNRDGYDGNREGDDGNRDGYGDTADGYEANRDGYDWNRDGYGDTADGFGGSRDEVAGSGGYPATGYAEPEMSDPMLVAPDAGVHPDAWLAGQEARREAGRRGPAVGAVTGFLAVAVGIGVSTLAAAFAGPRAWPVAAVGSVFTDRTPAAARTFAAHHFGAHGHAVLLLGMYVAIAVLAAGAGLATRHAAALGVAAVAAFSALAAFMTITRPGSQVSDAGPSVAGGLAAVAALLWLMHASAPVPPLRHARGGGRRRPR